MSNMGYILRIKNNYQQFKPFFKEFMRIEMRIESILEKHKRSFYWLAKTTGISHTTLWRLKKGKALGINFATLEKICEALDCQPGDVLKLGSKTDSK